MRKNYYIAYIDSEGLVQNVNLLGSKNDIDAKKLADAWFRALSEEDRNKIRGPRLYRSSDSMIESWRMPFPD